MDNRQVDAHGREFAYEVEKTLSRLDRIVKLVEADNIGMDTQVAWNPLTARAKRATVFKDEYGCGDATCHHLREAGLTGMEISTVSDDAKNARSLC